MGARIGETGGGGGSVFSTSRRLPASVEAARIHALSPGEAGVGGGEEGI